MLDRSTPIAEESLRGLHPHSIDNSTEIQRLLKTALENHSVFHRGLNTKVDLEVAHLREIHTSALLFHAANFENVTRRQIFLSFSVGGRGYFFSTTPLGSIKGELLRTEIPATIFYSERRDRLRHVPDSDLGDGSIVRITSEQGEICEASVIDVSPGGFGLRVPQDAVFASHGLFDLKLVDGLEAGATIRAHLRNSQAMSSPAGWTRIGVALTKAERIKPIEMEYWTATYDGVNVIRDTDSTRGDKKALEPEVLQFTNSKGEQVVGLIDSWGERCAATAVVIPNGWGQTKEAMLPLARAIVATFRASGEPICVVRFDGIRKRGESYNDPPCRLPGREYQNYVFSQGADDIEEIARFLKHSSKFQASSVALVSFSAAAIEARNALARDRERLIDAWISVVGAPDLQSMARSISGGIDFMGGSERGISFGVQELLGVTVDIDKIVADGVENKLMFIEDARRDLAQIKIPITWYHGAYDSWIDCSRIQDVLAIGNANNRRLIVMPIGHQLKNSNQASQVFGCIASEIGRLVLGVNLPPRCASTRETRELRVKERARTFVDIPDLRNFWRNYLIGRDQSYGIELLNSGSAYHEMMREQVNLLKLRDGDRVADLGSGVGAFGIYLAEHLKRPNVISIYSIDYVREAHKRARFRILQNDDRPEMEFSYIDADLNLINRRCQIPLASGSLDAVIASLLLSYLENPALLLRESKRVLRKGGRLVVSSLCKDADISGLYTESAAELTMGRGERVLPGISADDLQRALRNFLNDASKVLELEELGAFQFWEVDELIQLVSDNGFGSIRVRRSLGYPPQALVVSAVRI